MKVNIEWRYGTNYLLVDGVEKVKSKDRTQLVGIKEYLESLVCKKDGKISQCQKNMFRNPPL
mgnify:CR=1 FL=1